MLTISSITFSSVDMVDSSIRAAIDSAGNYLIFGVKYLSKINYIGIGRAVLAVKKEYSMERKEEALLTEKRILIEKYSSENVGALIEYRTKLENLIDKYFAEDLEAYLSGSDEIEDGIAEINSNKIIHGNIVIQQVLGKKIQYHNQSEFDALMGSDEVFKL